MTHFLDTNIFVYQFDEQDARKRDRARELVRSSLADGTGICSSQVVNEFCHLALRRFATPMSPQQCALYLDAVLAPLCAVGWSQALVRDALRHAERWDLGWYDALIVAAAARGGATTLYSEDLQDGMRFGAVEVRNPFAPR